MEVYINYNGQKLRADYDPITKKVTAKFPAPPDTSAMNTNGIAPGVGDNARGLGFYPITVQAIDEAGNMSKITYDMPEFSSGLKLFVYENIKPTITDNLESVVHSTSINVRLEFIDTGSGIKEDSILFNLSDYGDIPVTPIKIDDSRFYCEHLFENLQDKEYIISASVSDYDNNIKTVTKSFTVKTKIIITLDTNGGIPIEPIHATYGITVGDLPIPERAGYDFSGWYLNGELLPSDYPIIDDITLIAYWKLIDNCAIISELLINNWNTSLAEFPIIHFEMDYHTGAIGVDSNLCIYEINDIYTPVGIGYITEDNRCLIQIELQGSNRNRVLKQKDEIKRCLMTSRQAPNEKFDYLEVKNVDLQQYHNNTKVVINLVLMKHTRNIL